MLSCLVSLREVISVWYQRRGKGGGGGGGLQLLEAYERIDRNCRHTSIFEYAEYDKKGY